MSSIHHFNIPVVKHSMEQHFSDNITRHTLSTLSNMLAIYYAIMPDPKMLLEAYILKCIKKLQLFLGKQIIVDESFSTALTLFAAAIVGSHDADDDVMCNEKAQEAIVDCMMNMHFADSTDIEKQRIKIILTILLNQDNQRGAKISTQDILNYFHKKPKFMRAVILNAAIKYNNDIIHQQNNIIDHVYNRISQLIIAFKAAQAKTDSIRKLANVMVMAAMVASILAVGVTSSGVLIPLLSIPAMVLSTKISTNISDKIGGVILRHHNQVSSKTMKEMNLELIREAKETQAQMDKLSEIAQDNITPLNNISIKHLHSIKSDLTMHLPSSQDQTIMSNNIAELNAKIQKNKSTQKREV